MTDSRIIRDTPVCMLIYRRPDLTRRVFEVVRQARPSTLLVVADGPRPDRPQDGPACDQARAVIRDVDWDCRVLTDFAPENLGLRRRVSSGLDWVFSQVDRAIILEDDCLPSPDFFPYCAELLERYAEDERVMLISGDNANGYRPRGASYFFTTYALIWGWATWRRAWRRNDDTMSDWPQRRDSGWTERAFVHPRAVAHWKAKFEDGHRRFNSWARAWLYSCVAQGGLCAVPGVNLVSNIGFGDLATHTKGLADGRSQAPSEVLEFPLRHPGTVAADPGADRFLERRLYSGCGTPVSHDQADAWKALQAWRSGNPWRAGAILETLDDRLPGSDAVRLALGCVKAGLGLWDQASPLFGGIRPDSGGGELYASIRPELDPVRYRARSMPRPNREDRMRFLRRAGLDQADDLSMLRLGGDGRGYGAWVVADGLLGPESVCYLAGAGEDITFDCALAGRYGCEIHVMDPTPRAVVHYEKLGRFLESGGGADDPVFGKYAGTSLTAYRRLRYHDFGLFSRNAVLDFYEPRIPEHVSHSVVNLQGTQGSFQARCLTLAEAMRSLGHSRLDLLKLDIEGAEYCVVESFLHDRIDVGMLCIEFDEGYNPLDERYQERMLDCLSLLRANGYRAVRLDDWNLTLVRRDGRDIAAVSLAAAAALNAGGPEEAVRLLSGIAHEHPDRSGLQYGLALALARSGRTVEARKTVEGLLERRPEHRAGLALRQALSTF